MLLVFKIVETYYLNMSLLKYENFSKRNNDLLGKGTRNSSIIQVTKTSSLLPNKKKSFSDI